MIQNRERMYLNVVKGIAVFLMIWGHCIQYCAKDGFSYYDNALFQMIYSFHMPLFMLISGYLFFFSFDKRDLNALLVHRTQGMLQPIVFASILNLFLMELPNLLLYGSISVFDGALFDGFFSLWFLWCVLSASTAVAVAGKLARNFLLQVVFLLMGFLFVALFPENDYHLYMYPYFVAGFLYGRYRSRIPSWAIKLAGISLVAFPLLLRSYRSWHLIYITPVLIPEVALIKWIKINGFRWLIGFAGSLFVLTAVAILLRWTERRKFAQRIFGMLAKLGENSLAIYCISVSLLSYYLMKFFDRFLAMTGRNIFAENIGLFNYVFTPVLAIAYCFALYYVVLFMKKIKIHRIIFGR